MEWYQRSDKLLDLLSRTTGGQRDASWYLPQELSYLSNNRLNQIGLAAMGGLLGHFCPHWAEVCLGHLLLYKPWSPLSARAGARWFLGQSCLHFSWVSPVWNIPRWDLGMSKNWKQASYSPLLCEDGGGIADEFTRAPLNWSRDSPL